MFAVRTVRGGAGYREGGGGEKGEKEEGGVWG